MNLLSDDEKNLSDELNRLSPNFFYIPKGRAGAEAIVFLGRCLFFGAVMIARAIKFSKS